MCQSEDVNCRQEFPEDPKYWCDECTQNYACECEARSEGDR